MPSRPWLVRGAVATALLPVLSVVVASPALAEDEATVDVPPVLEADLSATEEQTLAAATSGEGVPLSAFVTTPDGPEILTLDAGSRADAATAAAVLEAQPSVEAAGVSQPARATSVTYADYLYGNTMLRSEAARAEVDHPLSDVVVAVLDTGVSRHPELVSALVPGRNFTDSAGGALDVTDRHGHGTHVAGTIAADAGSDVEGVAPGVRVLPVKVLGDSGSGWDSWISSGIVWAADNGADVINMSLGGPGSSSVEASAIAYARSKGVTVIAAAGNENSSAMHSPAGLPGVVGVAAVDDTKARASFSNYGPSVDVAAPGVGILSTYLDGDLVFMSGTSMASPHVAGVAALVDATAPGLTPDQVEQALVTSATDLGAAGRDDYYGSGLVDAVRAVRAADALEAGGSTPVVAPPSAPGTSTPTPSAGAVRVAWSPPADDGGAPITEYRVSTYRGSTLVGVTTAAATARSATVGGLVNGTAYTVAVAAVNEAGVGPSSARSAAVTPRTAPAAPAIGQPTPDNAAVTVRWTAPRDTGGAAVTGYSVRVHRGDSVVKTVTARAGSTSLSVTGLANGTGYRFSVAAVNAAGTGRWSATSATVTPRTVAGAPTIGRPSAGNAAATVRWVAPKATGGAAVTGYTVRVYRGTKVVKTVTARAGTTSLVVKGLTNGTAYRFTVAAVNAAGTGRWSATSATVTPRR
ncbi:S8 family serine peptidase [Geodermatophilus sp. SYSU D00965]